MGLPGSSVTERARLTWTRGEFSSGSTTRIYESSAIGSLGSEYASVPSGTTSYNVEKTLANGSAPFTRYYRVKHCLADGTSFSVQSNQVSVTWDPGA